MNFTIIGQLIGSDPQQPLANLVVEASYRYKGQVLKTDKVSANSKGGFKLQFSDELLANVVANQSVEVFFQVYRGNLQLESSGGIKRLKARNYKLKIKVASEGNDKNKNGKCNVQGTVSSERDGRGVPNLKVEAWDKTLVIADLLGTAKTDTKGRFTINFYDNYHQEICVDRKPDVFFKVFSGKELVCTTEDSVFWNVSDPDIQVTLSVNLPSSSDDVASKPRSFSVRGRVAKPDGTALVLSRVTAFDKQFGKEKILESTQTDAGGHYAICYTLDDLANPAKGSADLIVRVYKNAKSRKILASSPLILNALEEEVINLSVGEKPYRGRSEYRVVSERLQPLLKQMKGEELSNQDIAYFSNQTDLSIEQVQLYSESIKQSQRTKVEAFVLYGLYRSGMPYSFAALTVQNPESLKKGLNWALTKNIIEPMSAAEVAKAVESILARGMKELLDNDSPGRVHAAQLFDLMKLSGQEKRSVLKHYAITSDQPEKFWSDLKKTTGLSQKKAKALRRTFELNALSLNHMPLVEKLFANRKIESVKDLASMDTKAWKGFLRKEKVSAPEQLPGKNKTEQQGNYALILSRLVEDAFPTVAFSSSWRKNKTLDKDVASFFETNPDFAFESKGINSYLEERPGALKGMDDDTARAYRFKLQAVQNLFRISPQFERIQTVSALWQDNIHSAHSIKRMGQEKFVAKYENTIGVAQANLVYAKAEKVAGFTLMALARYAWDTNSISPYAIPKTDLKANPDHDARATLTSIFGNLDFCHCEHCRSVLGPAAYLVDILMFLNNSTAIDRDTGLEKLFVRRPDIGNIELNCDNTKIPLPYIDLVNEVLENVVVPRTYTSEIHDGTKVFNGDVYQTDEKRSDYLQANPEHINPDAYNRLKISNYPWILPFNLWTEEARIYLAQLGVKRHELMEVFNGNGASSPTESQVLDEAIGLIPEERGLLTTTVTNTAELKTLWGVKSGPLIGTVRVVSSFLQRIQNEDPQIEGAKPRYPQLEALLQCRFINPMGISGAIKISIDEEFPCSLDRAELTNLTNPKLDRLHRFVRLQNKLGWSFFQLDKALTAFGKTTIDSDFLDKLSRTVSLKESLNVDLPTALSWWSATLDTAEYKDTPSQYVDLFLNKAVGELTDTARRILELTISGDGSAELTLPVGPAASAPKMTDADYETIVLGACKIGKDDLSLILKEDLEGDDTLNLAHLTHIFRVASFSQATNLSVNEYYLLRKLTGIQPLSSPATSTVPRYEAIPQETKAFVEARINVAASGVSLTELVYLLAHDTSQPNNNQLTETIIAQRLTEIREGLAAIYWANQKPVEGLDAILAEKLGEILEGEEARNIAILIIMGSSRLPAPEQKIFIVNHFADFLDTAVAGNQLVEPLNALGSDIALRIVYVLEPLLAYLILQQSWRYLEQKLSESLSLSVDAAKALLQKVRNPDDSSQSAGEAFQVDTFVSSTEPVDSTVYASQFKVYQRIYKASRLINATTTTAVDQAFIVNNGAAVGWPDVNTLPLTEISSSPSPTELFDRFIAMVMAYQVGPRILTSGATLAEFLEEANAPDITVTATRIKQLLADSTAWSLDDIETLTTNYGYGIDDLKKSGWLVQLYKAFSILKRLGVGAARAWGWNTADVTFDQAVQIKFAVKSRYDDREWLSIAPVLRDPLRAKQRDALLAYVTQEGVARDPMNPAGRRKDFYDADDVYGYLLIDPQMNACRDTSRIKNAISSVQLFVQRILMNLEKDEIEFEYADAKQWKWRKNYRVWEANRKVFLWPENWIYPDLRDDKSPFFKEMEDELNQSDIDNNNAERALMSYLKKLDEVAYLEVSGMYEDTEQNVLHVVARTQSTPHKYFYRRWINKQYWTAWEPVEAGIDGDHLIPVVHNRRLFLFWPKFMEKAVQPSGSSMAVHRDDPNFNPDDPDRYYEISMAWTQYRDGKWRETQVSTDFFITSITTELLAKEEYYFFADQTFNSELLIRCRLMPPISRFIELAQFQILHYNDVTDAVVSVEGLSVPLEAVILFGLEPTRNLRHLLLNKLPDGNNIFMELEKTRNERELALLTRADVDYFGEIQSGTEQTATLLNLAEDGFQLMLPHQYPTYTSQSPFFYSDSKRAFFVQPRDVYESPGNYTVSDGFVIDQNDYFIALYGKISEGFMSVETGLELEEGLSATGDRPYFDDTKRYYNGNKASGMVIDRTRMASPGYKGVSDVANRDKTVTIGGVAGLAPVVAEDASMLASGLSYGEVSFAVMDRIESALGREDLYSGLEIVGLPRWIGKKYRFQSFHHPYVPLMIQQLNRYGVEGLLAPTSDHGRDWVKLKRQQETNRYFEDDYGPTDVVDGSEKYPKDEFDFLFGGAYSQYNWELFFHTPLLIAERLMQNQKFEEAQTWFHYIFDPTETEGVAPKRFWKIKPFFEFDDETSIAGLMERLNDGDEEAEAQIEAWENDPFNPHRIARMRIVAYMRSVVMKYIDNLIAWGDSLFRRFSIESLNEAIQVYVLAAQILGRKPEKIEKTDVSSYTFNELFFTELDKFRNARVLVESSLPWMATHRTGSSSGESSVLDTLYFCIPRNDNLLEYWNTVADRLFKIRNCMDIEGVRRQPLLFEPPIDPGLLVKARAGGLDLSSVLSELFAPLPYYRFRVILQRANEFCPDVRALGSLLLQALEKRDVEALSMLRATNQIGLLKSLRRLKEKAIEEAEYNKEALSERKLIAEFRYEHYENLDFMNLAELVGVDLSGISILTHGIGVVMEAIAGGISLLPQYTVGVAGFGGTPAVTIETGGQNIGFSLGKAASVVMQAATILDKGASLSYTLASYLRRQEEWDLQRGVAKKEIDDIAKQMLAADVRIKIAWNDLDSHDLQIGQAKEEAGYLESKFTNKELYNWMVTQVSTLYFQSYQMAYDLAKKAEQCFRHELGIRDTNYIQFGYWDSLKKGLLVGERLQKDLRRLDAAYLEQNRREFELTKNISLAQLNPVALLQLKQTGICEFIVPEVLFDVDHPGHYMRRIKSVSLTIPCVVGPYTSVGAKLTMLESRVRTGTAKKNSKYVYQGIDDERFVHDLVATQSIATSTGQRDTGLFELAFGDERYLPFEGGGVVSGWRLEMPGKWQDDSGNWVEWAQFDYETINDVILHVQYTARDGGDLFKKYVRGELRESFNKVANILAASDTGLTRIFSATHEFGTEWHNFMYPSADATSQQMTLKINKRLFSFMFQERPLNVSKIKVVMILKNPSIYGGGRPLQITLVHPDSSETLGSLAPDIKIGDQPSLSSSTSFTINGSEKEISFVVNESDIDTIKPMLIETRDGKSRLNPTEIKDILLEMTYTVGSV